MGPHDCYRHSGRSAGLARVGPRDRPSPPVGNGYRRRRHRRRRGVHPDRGGGPPFGPPEPAGSATPPVSGRRPLLHDSHRGHCVGDVGVRRPVSDRPPQRTHRPARQRQRDTAHGGDHRRGPSAGHRRDARPVLSSRPSRPSGSEGTRARDHRRSPDRGRNRRPTFRRRAPRRRPRCSGHLHALRRSRAHRVRTVGDDLGYRTARRRPDAQNRGSARRVGRPARRRRGPRRDGRDTHVQRRQLLRAFRPTTDPEALRPRCRARPRLSPTRLLAQGEGRDSLPLRRLRASCRPVPGCG